MSCSFEQKVQIYLHIERTLNKILIYDKRKYFIPPLNDVSNETIDVVRRQQNICNLAFISQEDRSYKNLEP